jgi:hypothetical protein
MNSAKPMLLAAFAVLLLAGGVQAQQTAPQRIAAIKASLASSKAVLAHYEWISTTTVSLNGEVKSTKQTRNFYGPDGMEQKVPLGASPPPEQRRGLRGAIIANRTAELTDYMKSAVALVKTYVPPSGARLEVARAAGGITIGVPPSGAGARLNIPNYEKPGDKLSIDVDLATNKILGLSVATYLADPSDAVALNVVMGQLPGGASYPANVTLNAPAKGLTVTVANGGYHKVS